MWRTPGVPALLLMSMTGFSGYAALLSVAPLWVVHGGAGSSGAEAVNGVLMLFTVLTQPFVPRALRRVGWGAVMVAGLLLLGLPSLLHLLTDDLVPTLVLSGVRWLGFGILTLPALGLVFGNHLWSVATPTRRRGRGPSSTPTAPRPGRS